MRQLLLASALLLSACTCTLTQTNDQGTPTATPTPELVSTPSATPTASPEPTPTATPEPTPTATPAPPQLIDSWEDVVGTWHRDLLKGDVMTHFTMSMEPVQYPEQTASAGFYRQRYSENDGPETVSEGWYWVENEGELIRYGVHELGHAQTDVTWTSTACYRYEAPTRLLCDGWGQPFYQISTSPEPR